MADAQIIHFPAPQRLCSECAHAALHGSGVFCVEFRDFIPTETVANDCAEYEGA